jgi:hypothetical protein
MCDNVVMIEGLWWDDADAEYIAGFVLTVIMDAVDQAGITAWL